MRQVREHKAEVAVLVLLALFSSGIVVAAACTFKIVCSGPGAMPTWLAVVASIANIALAANYAAVFGIRSLVQGLSSARANEPVPEHLRVAAYVYGTMLVVAFVSWWGADFATDESEVVPLLPAMSETWLGVICGILASAAGIKVSLARARQLGLIRALP
jgi:hypothetical protein